MEQTMAKYHQGIFKPINPQKYKGDPTNITYRSGWECRVMSHFDLHPDVIWWSSEEKIIPYRSPIDNRIHRYFPDFLVHMKSQDGKTQTVLIEVKPKSQTKPPAVPKNTKNRKYINEVMTWGINSSKWAAAEEYCKDRGYIFKILTEDDILGTRK